MNEVFVLMRMGENGEDGEMLCAYPTEQAAKNGMRFKANYDGEEFSNLEIFRVDFEL